MQCILKILLSAKLSPCQSMWEVELCRLKVQTTSCCSLLLPYKCLSRCGVTLTPCLIHAIFSLWHWFQPDCPQISSLWFCGGDLHNSNTVGQKHVPHSNLSDFISPHKLKKPSNNPNQALRRSSAATPWMWRFSRANILQDQILTVKIKSSHEPSTNEAWCRIGRKDIPSASNATRWV